MMTRTLLVRCAPIAIAASVALPAIPATAQDTVTAEPAIVLPDPAPAPVPSAPAPTIVLPDPVPAAAPSVTAVEAAPADTAVEPRAVTRGATTRTEPSPAPVAVRAAAPGPQIDPAQTGEVSPAVTAPVAVPATAREPVSPAAATATTDDETGEIALAALLALLGVGVVGGVAYAASRRRRRSSMEEQYEPVAYEPATGDAIAPTPVMEPARVAESPRFAAPAASAFAAPVIPPRTAPALRATGDPVALPAELPETFEERDALLKELIAAEPDKANPFTSPRARARRAKLIMQSLGRSFSSRKPRIDLSEYTNRWPALRGWQPATA